jgi:glycosyltransferase involved in cell wall biosynthesis
VRGDPVRVLIDTSYARRGPSGTGVYVEQLVRALRDRSVVEVVEAAQPRRLPPGGGSVPRSVANALLDLHWLHVGLPAAARGVRADLVHHPLPARSRGLACPQVVTFHDVAFEAMPGGYGRFWRALARRAYQRAASQSEAIVCVSEHTASDVVGLLGASASRIVVAPHGPGQVEGLQPPAAERTHLLYVGDDQDRKNVALLLDAYGRYRDSAAEPVDLVVAGRAATSVQSRPGVRGVPRPSREELVALYGSAIALAHPSAHEGFGLTVLEALSLGTPVVALRNAATEGLGGAAALLVDDAAQMATQIARLASDPGLRDELSGRGRQSAAGFSWAASARVHERAYTLASR